MKRYKVNYKDLDGNDLYSIQFYAPSFDQAKRFAVQQMGKKNAKSTTFTIDLI